MCAGHNLAAEAKAQLLLPLQDVLRELLSTREMHVQLELNAALIDFLEAVYFLAGASFFGSQLFFGS